MSEKTVTVYVTKYALTAGIMREHGCRLVMSGDQRHEYASKNGGVTNETNSDGVYWQDPGGHLVHISGWYNRVQVQGGRWGEAAKSLGIDESRCTGGVYQLAAP